MNNKTIKKELYILKKKKKKKTLEVSLIATEPMKVDPVLLFWFDSSAAS
jgi:hypothetical protein